MTKAPMRIRPGSRQRLAMVIRAGVVLSVTAATFGCGSTDTTALADRSQEDPVPAEAPSSTSPSGDAAAADGSQERPVAAEASSFTIPSRDGYVIWDLSDHVEVFAADGSRLGTLPGDLVTMLPEDPTVAFRLSRGSTLLDYQRGGSSQSPVIGDAPPLRRMAGDPPCKATSYADIRLCQLRPGPEGPESPPRPRSIVIDHEDGRQVTIDPPPDDELAAGSWYEVSRSPDGRWLAATWGAECDSFYAFVTPTDHADLQPLLPAEDGPAGSRVLGWTSDSQVVVETAGSCGDGGGLPTSGTVYRGAVGSPLTPWLTLPGDSTAAIW